MPAAPSVSNFVNRNNANPFEESNGPNSPSARGSSRPRQTNNNASLDLAERPRGAANARMPMPATRRTNFKVESDTDLKGLAKVVANRPVSVASNGGRQVKFR